ncbi:MULTISPECIES: hypothetical protein [unclassified Rhodanobacter]|uniref:hypothetical protein n=1 Tax=unclassified Rhodanobacter TaxID=2621553 RepID=UPI001BDF79FF|nr:MULTISPECIES: hypothetical protein [unclassified Rhodanobacter]MBT2145540.1 hypothetical protein [Rhodanobacter sp. LX-99]MBT2149585.1 hypothetical protein [Rhodanobacter sp. LX-100]
MAFLEIDPKKFAILLARGTHEGELRKFFVESRAQLLLKGAKVQNMPHGREERVRAISERFPPKTDEVLRAWFQKNISLADPLAPEEVLLYLGAYFDEGEPLPEAEAQVICRSALVYLVGDTPNADLLHLLQRSRDPHVVGGTAVPLPEKVSPPPEPAEASMPKIVAIGPESKTGPEKFQLAELLAAIISGDEGAIDSALVPFAESTQLMVEALLRLREGDVEAANEKLKLLGDNGPESELLRSALARTSHHRDSGAAPTGVRTEIPAPLDEDPHTDAYEIVGIYTNESDTGAVFVKPLFVVLEGKLRQLNDVARDRLFPDSGSVMTFRSVLRRPLRRRELVHWKVSEREGVEGKTRFHLESELGPLIEAVRIQVPSGDADEVRRRIKVYATEGRGQLGQQVMFLLADGVAIVSPKGVDFARDEAFESPWQSWGSLETWLIEGHQYCLEASQGAASYLDLSPLDAAFRKLLKSLDAEQRLPITKAQRNELTARLRAQSGSEIASRAKRIADSIDQISINEEELDAVLKLLGSREIVDRRVDELIAIEHEKRQAEKVGLQDEISSLKKKKLELEKEGHHIERSNRAQVESASASVREAFAKAVREGASTLANAEVFKLLVGGVESPTGRLVPVDDSGKVVDWVKRGALSQGDVIGRLSMLGINRRRAFVLSRLVGIAAAAGVALILKGGMARQCVQTLVRQDREVVAIVDISMGLTSSDFMRQTLTDLAELQGVAFLNADLSPIEIYAAELIDLLVEQAMLGVHHPRPIMLSCIGGDFSMSIPIALRRLSLVLDLDLDWDENQLLLDQVEADSLLLLPALQERLSSAISATNDDDRKYIEPALVNALHTK